MMTKIKPFIFPACVIIIMILFHCFFLIYQVHGDSMVPNLSNKNFGIAVKTNVASINRFNIVVIKTENKYLVKRVIGLPGEKIDYIDGKLYVNDEYIEETFDTAGETRDFSVTLNANEYYCLGDNREHSTDSRVYGPFNKSAIKAVLIGG